MNSLLNNIADNYDAFEDQVFKAKEDILRKAYKHKYGIDIEDEDGDVPIECLVSQEGKEMFLKGDEAFCIMDQPQLNDNGEVYIPCYFPENMKVDLEKIRK